MTDEDDARARGQELRELLALARRRKEFLTHWVTVVMRVVRLVTFTIVAGTFVGLASTLIDWFLLPSTERVVAWFSLYDHDHAPDQANAVVLGTFRIHATVWNPVYTFIAFCGAVLLDGWVSRLQKGIARKHREPR